MVREDPLWTASNEAKEKSQLLAFLSYAEEQSKRSFPDYIALHQWSIEELDVFWGTLARFLQIEFAVDYTKAVTPARPFYKSEWFAGSKLSYVHHIERQFKSNETALLYRCENKETIPITWNSLFKRAKQIKEELEEKGVQKGDVVVGYLRHHPDTIASFLATNALGGVWSCCSPDFGVESVVQRFEQLQPKVLCAHESYSHKGKVYSLKDKIEQISQKISSQPKQLLFDGSLNDWDFYTEEITSLSAIPVGFDHPIWVLFSSGTTGQPKAITHRTGGMLLEQLKALRLHQEVEVGERFFWNTTTGWMMWNYSLGALLCGAVLAIYDGATDLNKHWRFAQQEKLNHFGHGAPFYESTMLQNIELNKDDFTSLKTIGSTGSPLAASCFEWMQKRLPQTHIISLSGGTDVCSAFLGGNVLLPTYAGYLQCAMLGAAVQAVDANGQPQEGKVGELVLAQPMPCMPIYFWNDPTHQRYHSAYFDQFEGVWTHGDWLDDHPEKGYKIHGRADATLNRNGIRMGTAEIYNALTHCEVLSDALVVEANSQLILFAVAKEKREETEKKEIRNCIRTHCSPRHLPDAIHWVDQIPYTISGKKMELPVKKIMEGANAMDVVSIGAMKNPSALKDFIRLGGKT